MASKVTSLRVPYLPIAVGIPEKHLSLDLTALLDNGFNSDVIVPQPAVANGVPALLQNDIRLADDSRITVPGYLGNVRVGDTTIEPVMVLVMGNEAILGLNVITQFQLTIDHDRSLTVEP
ncbi:MAG TPA: hypothetical protein VK821_07560 [Dehalococcoidia bacterium]|nr:hypothetical protein [Dehalococcoidia bacterium]